MLGSSLRTIQKNKVLDVSLQLPTYDGTKSYQNLLVEVYGGTDGYLLDSNLDVIIQNNPISFIRSGRYYYGSGSIVDRSNESFYWGLIPVSDTYARYLYFYSTYLNPQSSNYKGNGFSFRCLVR